MQVGIVKIQTTEMTMESKMAAITKGRNLWETQVHLPIQHNGLLIDFGQVTLSTPNCVGCIVWTKMKMPHVNRP